MKPLVRVEYAQTSGDPRSEAVTLRLACGHTRIDPEGSRWRDGNGDLAVVAGAELRCPACPDVDDFALFSDVRSRLGTDR